MVWGSSRGVVTEVSVVTRPKTSIGTLPSFYFVVTQKFLGTSLSTDFAKSVNRQTVRVPHAKLCFALTHKTKTAFAV